MRSGFRCFDFWWEIGRYLWLPQFGVRFLYGLLVSFPLSCRGSGFGTDRDVLQFVVLVYLVLPCGVMGASHKVGLDDWTVDCLT